MCPPENPQERKKKINVKGEKNSISKKKKRNIYIYYRKNKNTIANLVLPFNAVVIWRQAYASPLYIYN